MTLNAGWTDAHPVARHVRVAVEVEEEMAEEMTFEEYEAALQRPVTVTPQQVANVIHGKSYGYHGEHSMVNSCPCYHLALFYLGLTDSHGVYWPDGEGGNAWDAAAPTTHGEG